MMTSRAQGILVVVVNFAREYENMAANEAFKTNNTPIKRPLRVILTETDVPGASLKGRKPDELKNDELRRWLKCRGASVSGTRVKLLERLKTYVSSGLDKKIVDPDGGIHYRIKQENDRCEGYITIDHDDKLVEWPKEGWTKSLDKAPEFQHCYIFSYLSGGRTADEKRRGAFKSKREGYALFKASHVRDVKFNSSHDKFCFFDARVKASMTRNKVYRTRVRQNKSGEVLAAHCNCKAGANGYCKHVGALLYTILDYTESELKEIPPNTTCTEKPQQWHKPSHQAQNRPLRFKDILMIKHDYEADKTKKKTVKRLQRKKEKKVFSACPSYAVKVTKEQIEGLCKDLKNIDGTNALMVDLLEGNDCEPVKVKEIEDKSVEHGIKHDHDYLPCKTDRVDSEVEVTAIEMECNHLKKSRMYCMEGNECEPIDDNSWLSSDFVISHSVVISSNTEPDVVPCEEVISEETMKDPVDLNVERDPSIPTPSQNYPDVYDLCNPSFVNTCKGYLKSIEITEENINNVEEATRGQSNNSEWFKYRNGRLTASKFGEINNRRNSTPPDRLVRDLFNYKARPHTPYQCKAGLEMEPIIISKYIETKNTHGDSKTSVQGKGLVIDKENPVLAASVDGEVTDSTNKFHPVGNIEVKYKLFPTSAKEEVNGKDTELLKVLAKKTKNFCLESTESGLRLKKKHPYYAQIQGGMAITQKPWCDFVVYTSFMGKEDMHIERVCFDPIYWEALKKKLLDFYTFAVIPELLTARVKRGVPLYPSIYSYK